MNLKNIDLNLLVYLDVLLHKHSVTNAAESLGISQPAMSNALQRLRNLFADPLLVRTSNGMSPTERAEQLKPKIREIVAAVESAVTSDRGFDALNADRVFRISISDYGESTLVPLLLRRMRSVAPNITLDLLTPSDVSYQDMEHGNVDMVINRFDAVPESLHQKTIWRDSFTCLINHHNPIRDHFNMDSYLQANHVWVSKSDFGVGVGVEPGSGQQLGWVDAALAKLGKTRRIRVFTRHYHSAMQMAELRDVIITVPTRAARLLKDDPGVILLAPPFEIPKIKLKMAWGPLLHHNPAHQWLRRLITEVTRQAA